MQGLAKISDAHEIRQALHGILHTAAGIIFLSLDVGLMSHGDSTLAARSLCQPNQTLLKFEIEVPEKNFDSGLRQSISEL